MLEQEQSNRRTANLGSCPRIHWHCTPPTSNVQCEFTETHTCSLTHNTYITSVMLDNEAVGTSTTTAPMRMRTVVLSHLLKELFIVSFGEVAHIIK
jgi:hypothetical protein